MYNCFDKGSYCPRRYLSGNAHDPPEEWDSGGPPDTTCRPCQKQMDPIYQASLLSIINERDRLHI